MSRKIEIAKNLHAEIGDQGVAELVFGPEGCVPVHDTEGHVTFSTAWDQLATEPCVRCIPVRRKDLAPGTPPTWCRT